MRTSAEGKERLKAEIFGKGEYSRFKPHGHWTPRGADRIETFNVNRNLDLHEQPSTLGPFCKEVENFVRTVHVDVLYKVLVALGLDIDDKGIFRQASRP